MSFKILHILHDEKFIDGAIETFNSTSVSNTYISIDDTKPFNYIKKYASIVHIIKKEALIKYIIDGGFNLVAFHTLTRDKYDLVLSIPNNVKILWLSWGYDIYQPWNEMPAILKLDLYKPITKRIISPKVSFIFRVKRKLNKIIFHKKYKKQRDLYFLVLRKELELQERMLSRIDYMSTVLPSEYDMFLNFNNFRAQYFPFQYTSKKKNDESQQIKKTASKILIGNSATPTNNHFDILFMLRRNNIMNECIIPCSYGDIKYTSIIKKYIRKYSNITILDSFLPKEEYLSLLKDCSVGIFGHMRQQAIGNIVICLLQGSKVFLWRDSVAYKYFYETGYIIYTIDDDLTSEGVNTPMSDEDKEVNRRLVLDHFNFYPVVNKLNNFLSSMYE